MRRVVALLVMTALLASCATATNPNTAPPAKPNSIKEWMAVQSRAKKRAVAGFLIGAALGAVSAGITGGNGEEIAKRAIAGGVAGAIAGFAIGKHQDQVYAQRDLAVRQAGYDRSQGYVARIEEVAFNPPQPKPGTTATLYVRYLVLGPNPNEAIKVKMFRGLKYGEDYVFGAGPNEFTVPNGGGVVESTVEVTLSRKAPQGTYSVEALLEDPQGRFAEASGTGALYVVAQARQTGFAPAAP
jgi:outer membrane lipoprotein SlyB